MNEPVWRFFASSASKHLNRENIFKSFSFYCHLDFPEGLFFAHFPNFGGLKRSKFGRNKTSTGRSLGFLRTSIPSKPNSSPFFFLDAFGARGTFFAMKIRGKNITRDQHPHSAIVDTVNSEKMSLAKDGFRACEGQD